MHDYHREKAAAQAVSAKVRASMETLAGEMGLCIFWIAGENRACKSPHTKLFAGRPFCADHWGGSYALPGTRR